MSYTRPLINPSALTSGVDLAIAFNQYGVPPVDRQVIPQLVTDLSDIAQGLGELGSINEGTELGKLVKQYSAQPNPFYHVMISKQLNALPEQTVDRLSEMFFRSAEEAVTPKKDAPPQTAALVPADAAKMGFKVLLDGERRRELDLEALPPVETAPEPLQELAKPPEKLVYEPPPLSLPFVGELDQAYYAFLDLLQRVQGTESTAQAFQELRAARPETYGNDAINNVLKVAQVFVIIEGWNERTKRKGRSSVEVAAELLGGRQKSIASSEHHDPDENVNVRLQKKAISLASQKRARTVAAREALELIAACVIRGDIPAELAGLAADRNQIRIPTLQELKPGKKEWDKLPKRERRLLKIYRKGKLHADIEGIPLDDEIYNVGHKMQWFRRNPVPTSFRQSVQSIQDALKRSRSRPAVLREARKGYLRLKAALLRPRIELLREEGFHQMDELESGILKHINREEVREAEALLNFGADWIDRTTELIGKIYDREADLVVLGEMRAAELFQQNALTLLQHGEYLALRKLMSSVLEQVEEPKDIKLLVPKELRKGLRMALLTQLETLRSLVALPSAAERMRLARKVPPVAQLLADGAAKGSAVRNKLIGLGIPVPGQDVPALPIRGDLTPKKLLG